MIAVLTGIAFSRPGTELVSGSYRIEGFNPNAPRSTGAFTAAYTRRTTDRMRIALADSGQLTITTDGDRVRGTFTFYTSDHDVVALPPRGQTGGVLTILEKGEAQVTVTGAFDAPRGYSR